MMTMDSKEVLDEFLWNIKIGAYKKVVNGMTKTFQSSHSNTQLLDWAESCIPFKLKSYKIIERIKRTDGVSPEVFHSYKVEVIDSFGVQFDCFPNVVCEERVYKANKLGTWGVNPKSIVPKGLYQKRVKENAKNK